MEIAIIGGGIAGLSTALALKKHGISSTVYEQASELNEVGAGIWLQPNALKVLSCLGLKESILNSGVELDRVDITDSHLKPFKKGTNIVQDQDGNRIISIHRAKLQKLMFEGLPENSVRLGCEFKSLEQRSKGVEINFENQKIVADYVIAADGINSRIRKGLFPESALRHSGQTCWRGIASLRLKESFRGLGREAWGNRVRFGFSQVSDDLVYWFAVAKATPFQKDDKTQVKNKLHDMFKNFHPLVNEILDQTEADKIIRGDLLDLQRLNKWHSQRICLVGDAAHATTPNMGQGAGQAIEDAYVLAKLFSSDLSFEQLFSRFENIRREKVDYVVNNSWRFGKMAHSNLGQFVMKSLMKITPESVMDKQLEKLFSLPNI